MILIKNYKNNMSNSKINFGPLSGLIGVWKGNRGIDMAPEKAGLDENLYHETITFSPCTQVDNAESQVIYALSYHQIVQRKSNNNIFHDQSGYWMWDINQDIIMHSFTIPRAVCVLAGGHYKSLENGGIELKVSATLGDKDWGIIQSPFMQNNASTKKFSQTMTINNNKLEYSQMTIVDIYGKEFSHSDANSLELQV